MNTYRDVTQLTRTDNQKIDDEIDRMLSKFQEGVRISEEGTKKVEEILQQQFGEEEEELLKQMREQDFNSGSFNADPDQMREDKTTSISPTTEQLRKKTEQPEHNNEREKEEEKEEEEVSENSEVSIVSVSDDSEPKYWWNYPDPEIENVNYDEPKDEKGTEEKKNDSKVNDITTNINKQEVEKNHRDNDKQHHKTNVVTFDPNIKFQGEPNLSISHRKGGLPANPFINKVDSQTNKNKDRKTTLKFAEYVLLTGGAATVKKSTIKEDNSTKQPHSFPGAQPRKKKRNYQKPYYSLKDIRLQDDLDTQPRFDHAAALATGQSSRHGGLRSRPQQ